MVLVPCLVLGLSLVSPQPADAARGGRMGGGSFRAPSMPRSTPRSTGGYRGGYGGYRGGGFGFPFIIPIFGFGGGGLFGLLILMAVAGVLVNALRGAGSAPTLGGDAAAPAVPSKVNLIQVQVGLLAGAKALQDDLRSLAQTSDTSRAQLGCSGFCRSRPLHCCVNRISGSTPTRRSAASPSALLNRPSTACR